MSDKAWKQEERAVCRDLGGERRGPDTANKQDPDNWEGKNDCVKTPGFSVETKLHARPSFGVMLEDARRAVARKENPLDIGVATMRKKGRPQTERLAVMLWSEFLDHFGPAGKDGEE